MSLNYKFLLLLLSLLFIATESSAADWKKLYNGYFDASRVTKTGRGTIIIYTKTILSRERHSADNVSIPYENYSHTMSQIEYNCDIGEYRYLSVHDYSNDNTAVSNTNPNPNFEPALPETVAEYNLNVVCSYAKRSKPKKK
ncbi:surface-adhesin E family protein [Geomonas agri]|uniref:surface-adhesin E family protein n=1 Tax=Geomonas agri TaxID=2873702 RepID=UPI001CD6A172|nr:surface-adhesin E family protein [Geomonas agri]